MGLKFCLAQFVMDMNLVLEYQKKSGDVKFFSRDLTWNYPYTTNYIALKVHTFGRISPPIEDSLPKKDQTKGPKLRSSIVDKVEVFQSSKLVMVITTKGYGSVTEEVGHVSYCIITSGALIHCFVNLPQPTST